MSFALFKFFKKRAPIIGKVAGSVFSALLLSDLPQDAKEAAADSVEKVTDATKSVADAVRSIQKIDLDEDDLAEIGAELARLVARFALTMALKKAL